MYCIDLTTLPDTYNNPDYNTTREQIAALRPTDRGIDQLWQTMDTVSQECMSFTTTPSTLYHPSNKSKQML